MNELRQYLEKYEPFHPFGTSHLVVLLFILIFSLCIPMLSRKLFPAKLQVLTGIILGAFVTINFIAWYFVLYASDLFDTNEHLPLQLCHMGNLFILPVMMNRDKRWFRILYFWVMAGTLQAIVTPDIQAEFPHYWFFRYWIVHGGPVICIMYACLVYRLRPTWKSLLQSFAALNLFAVVIGIINVMAHTNYLYLCQKPAVASLMDWLGEWPWYLAGLEVIGFILFVLVYLPFVFSGRKFNKAPDNDPTKFSLKEKL
ncbi:MAG TPA: TIGR02206 family membrane protein [Flavitalea sp.]|nr:TIGR02206 family membrane protein [Flavitalea sp.]